MTPLKLSEKYATELVERSRDAHWSMIDNIRARDPDLAGRWIEQDRRPVVLQANIRGPSFPNLGLVLHRALCRLDNYV